MAMNRELKLNVSRLYACRTDGKRVLGSIECCISDKKTILLGMLNKTLKIGKYWKFKKRRK